MFPANYFILFLSSIFFYCDFSTEFYWASISDVGGGRDTVVSFWLGFAGGGNAILTTPHRKLIHHGKY